MGHLKGVYRPSDASVDVCTSSAHSPEIPQPPTPAYETRHAPLRSLVSRVDSRLRVKSLSEPLSPARPPSFLKRRVTEEQRTSRGSGQVNSAGLTLNCCRQRRWRTDLVRSFTCLVYKKATRGAQARHIDMTDFAEFKAQVVAAVAKLESLSSSCQQASSAGNHGVACSFHDQWTAASDAYDALANASNVYTGEGQQEELDTISNPADGAATRYAEAYNKSCDIFNDSLSRSAFNLGVRSSWKA